MRKFIAKIRLLSTSEGGRKGGIISGYRPNASFAESINTDVQFELINTDQLDPGDEATVSLTPVNFQSIESFLNFGSQFIIREGSKIIGQGIVLEIIESSDKLISKR